VKTRQNNNGAFTLIELILAIGIAAIVLVAVNAVFFTALRLRNAASDAVDAATPLDQAVSTLRRDLQCAVTPKANGILSGDFKIGNVLSSGSSEPVAAEIHTATGLLSRNQPWGDIQRVTYELRNSAAGAAAGRDLYRSVTRNLLTYGTPEVEDQLMLKGVVNVTFSCFDGSRWSDLWDTSDPNSISTNLPVAVRVSIQLAGNNANNVPPVEIVVPIDSQSRTNSTSVLGS
jgi:type II secretion system protein J